MEREREKKWRRPVYFFVFSKFSKFTDLPRFSSRFLFRNSETRLYRIRGRSSPIYNHKGHNLHIFCPTVVKCRFFNYENKSGASPLLHRSDLAGGSVAVRSNPAARSTCPFSPPRIDRCVLERQRSHWLASSLSGSGAPIDSMGPRQNSTSRTRDDTEQSKSTPAACDRIPTSVASNKQFTHSLVIRHKLQLCRSNSVRARRRPSDTRRCILLFFSRSCWIRSLCSALPCLVSAFVLTSSSLPDGPMAPSLSRRLWNCCRRLCRTRIGASCVLTEVADSPARGQAKQNAQLDASSLRCVALRRRRRTRSCGSGASAGRASAFLRTV